MPEYTNQELGKLYYSMKANKRNSQTMARYRRIIANHPENIAGAIIRGVGHHELEGIGPRVESDLKKIIFEKDDMVPEPFDSEKEKRDIANHIINDSQRR